MQSQILVLPINIQRDIYFRARDDRKKRVSSIERCAPHKMIWIVHKYSLLHSHRVVCIAKQIRNSKWRFEQLVSYNWRWLYGCWMMEEQKKTYKEESEKVVEMKNVNIQSKLKVNVFLIVTDNLLYSLCKQRNSVHSHRHTKNKNCLVSRARSISLSLSLASRDAFI